MFKYNEYPELKKAHKEHERLKKKVYKLDSKIRDNDDRSKDIAQEASDICGKYDEEVFAPIIYEIFKHIKPQLYNERDKKHEKWENVFKGEWSSLTQDQKWDLLGLVLEVGYGIYRLPDEYYNDVPLFKGFPTPIG